ncbi:hypothetical protein GGI17_005300 [Coemansia sp. S146]|nr:hypothetical protein GGI17_005300 [Coemansia sp. S146]
MKHNEGYERNYKANIDSGYYGNVTYQQGNDTVQPQEQVHEQQQVFDQEQFHQPGFNLPHEYPSQQPFNSGYEQGARYPNQPPLHHDFEPSPELGNNWHYNDNQPNGRPDELHRGYESGHDSGYDSTDGYGMERGMKEVGQKLTRPFVKKDEDGNNKCNKRNIACAAVVAGIVAVGTAVAVQKGLEHYRSKDDEERDVQIGGGSGYNDAHSYYPSSNAPPYTGDSEPYTNNSGAYPNNSGHYPSSEHYGSS